MNKSTQKLVKILRTEIDVEKWHVNLVCYLCVGLSTSPPWTVVTLLQVWNFHTGAALDKILLSARVVEISLSTLCSSFFVKSMITPNS